MKCMMWLNGSLVSSYIVNLGITNSLGGLYLMIWGSNGVESMSFNHWLIELGEARVTGTFVYCYHGS